MPDFQIPDKTQETSIDRSADSLLVYDNSASALRRASVNNLLDLTSHPVGINDIQTLTNKTISGADNTITSIDPTNVTGLPSVAAIATLTGNQTLTNKTLTSPAINTPTINNPTLNVDSISEFTSGAGVTIDGVLLKDSKMNGSYITDLSVGTSQVTDSAITTAKINDGAVTPAKLLAGTGTDWVWQSWTPTFTNFTVGSSTLACYYIQIGKTVICRFDLAQGAGSSMGTYPYFTLPVTGKSVNFDTVVGEARLVANSNGYKGTFQMISTTTVGVICWGAGGSYLSEANVTSTVPNTWGTTGAIRGWFMYEAA